MEKYVGEIRMFGSSEVPDGWLKCDGQHLEVVEYFELFSIIGSTFGGDGRTNFCLPDLRSRVVIGKSTEYPLGKIFGKERVTLDIDEMPKHNHFVSACNGHGDQAVPKNNFLGVPNELKVEHLMYRNRFNFMKIHPDSIGYSGEGRSHNNIQPCLAVNFCIAFEGIIPNKKLDSNKVEDEGGEDVRF